LVLVSNSEQSFGQTLRSQQPRWAFPSGVLNFSTTPPQMTSVGYYENYKAMATCTNPAGQILFTVGGMALHPNWEPILGVVRSSDMLRITLNGFGLQLIPTNIFIIPSPTECKKYLVIGNGKDLSGSSPTQVLFTFVVDPVTWTTTPIVKTLIPGITESVKIALVCDPSNNDFKIFGVPTQIASPSLYQWTYNGNGVVSGSFITRPFTNMAFMDLGTNDFVLRKIGATYFGLFSTTKDQAANPGPVLFKFLLSNNNLTYSALNPSPGNTYDFQGLEIHPSSSSLTNFRGYLSGRPAGTSGPPQGVFYFSESVPFQKVTNSDLANNSRIEIGQNNLVYAIKNNSGTRTLSGFSVNATTGLPSTGGMNSFNNYNLGFSTLAGPDYIPKQVDGGHYNFGGVIYGPTTRALCGNPSVNFVNTVNPIGQSYKWLVGAGTTPTSLTASNTFNSTATGSVNLRSEVYLPNLTTCPIITNTTLTTVLTDPSCRMAVDFEEVDKESAGNGIKVIGNGGSAKIVSTEACEVVIYNLAGSIVLKLQLDKETEQLLKATTKTGIYFYKAIHSDGVKTGRFVL